MTTKHYTIAGLNVQRNGDLWTIPTLLDANGGQLETAKLTFMAIDGVPCNPHCTAELLENVPDDCIWRIEASDGPTRGWGELDCDRNYLIHGHLISADLLEKLAEYTDLKLPVR